MLLIYMGRQWTLTDRLAVFLRVLRYECPGLRIGDIQKIISVQWKELNEQEKEVRPC